MSDRLRHFLLVYDIAGAKLRTLSEFDRPEVAVAAYEAAETEFNTDDNVQVVLVASDSLETVKRTHSNFWKGESIEALLQDVLAARR